MDAEATNKTKREGAKREGAKGEGAKGEGAKGEGGRGDRKNPWYVASGKKKE